MNTTFNLADLFERVVDRVPQRTALICGDKRSTFQELEARANQLAHHLATSGVGAGDQVGLYLYNGNEFLEAMWACFKIRAVPVNVNYRYVDEELLYLFENADMVGCIHNREFVPHIAKILGSAPKMKVLVSVDDDTGHDLKAIGAVEYEAACQAQSEERDFAQRQEDDLFILYTGGTTGMPKGVMWPQKNLFMAALGGGGFLTGNGPCTKPEDIDERIIENPMVGMALAPLMHGACWWYALIQMLAGSTVTLNPLRTFDGAEIWNIVERESVNSIAIVGDAMAIPLLDALDQYPKRWDLSSIFNIGSGGAIFSPTSQDAFRAHFPDVFITNAFGSSEAGNMGFDSGKKKTSAGLGNVVRDDFMDVITSDDDGATHRHAQPGENGIFARSGYIPRGYYGDPVKTAKTFVPVAGKTWLLTGDEATLEDDGSITIFGRGSNCINSGGEKIFPEEVEQALKAHPSVFDVLVVATPDERWGSKVTAVVALRAGAELSLDSLQEEARKHISGYKLPREMHLVPEVPRAPSGKPNYAKAEEIALSGAFRA
ncbi:MAG: acyl-CoA synthetase [Deltaproteobacteria bacterium]